MAVHERTDLRRVAEGFKKPSYSNERKWTSWYLCCFDLEHGKMEQTVPK